MEAPRWWLLVPALLAVGHCLALANQEDSGPMDPGPPDVPPGPALPCHKLSVSNIDFAFELYRQLASEAPGENVLFSPVQGPQLLLTLGQRRFSGLGPGAAQDPAGAQHSIREYVEKQTRGQLGAWVEGLSDATAEVLVSHLLLRAGWVRPFDPRATSLKKFFVDEHRAVQVPMMRQKARHRFLHDPELQCTVLQMEHAAGATTFFVFPQRGGLRQLEDALLPETLIKWDSQLRTRELDFYFPKFSISSSARLELLLPGAAVGGGLPEPGLNISKVAHKAAMTLDEGGTEVAAATSIQLTPGPRPDRDLHASPAPDTEFNRPFLVMTFHTDTGSMLLLGRVVNPLGCCAG
uniref:Serpin domain-containing protein n=1 Tax=Myotis myotis TaxID=51298 RepID=A0A7J7QTR7_MYOMY|nr:hypothetical protein mMyoMyo1_017280 [Myotis myotis]